MRYLLSRAATVEVEDASEEAGVSRGELMQRAGKAVAVHAQALVTSGRVVVFCGTGNNGGDGWVAARLLSQRHRQVQVISACPVEELKGIARAAAQDALDAGVSCEVLPKREQVVETLSGAGLVIDAMLGTGFHGELRAPYDDWCPLVTQADAPVLSVDVPSGLYCDSGDSAWGAVHATMTMACIAIKPGMVGGMGGELCGELAVDDLGCWDLLGEDTFTLHASGQYMEAADFRDMVSLPTPNDNKYTRGALLVMAGSSTYTGAPMMAALAGARAGAGYVTLATPEPNVSIMQQRLMSIPVRPLVARGGVIDRHAEAAAVEYASHADAVVYGPGLGRTRAVGIVLMTLLQRCEAPLLVDADGLYVLAGMANDAIERAEKHRPLVLTPHYGELLRLAEGAGIDVADKPRHADEAVLKPMEFTKLAVQVARAYGATVVAKGPLSVVTNGATTIYSADGCPALSTAGTGDTLAGVIGSELAQGLDPLKASILGLHLGGLAAWAAARERSTAGVMAEDVIDKLGSAILETVGS